jgi:hypothetical protein
MQLTGGKTNKCDIQVTEFSVNELRRQLDQLTMKLIVGYVRELTLTSVEDIWIHN